MIAGIRLCWRDGVTAGTREHGQFWVEGPTARVTLRQPGAATVSALERLAPPGDDEAALDDHVLGAGGVEELTRWYFALQRLACRGLVVRTVHAEGTRLATLVPVSPGYRLDRLPRSFDQPVVLSPFAYVRREGAALVVESPRARARLVLDSPRALGLIGVLATPVLVDDRIATTAGLPAGSVRPLVGLLASAGMLQGDGPDDESPALRAWEFHDLLFHARSRKGRSDAPFGAAYRPDAGPDPPLAFPPEGTGASVELAQPDPAQLAQSDPSLTSVMDARRSIREYGEQPLTLAQLGEFLYRVARAKETRQVETETPYGPVSFEVAPRPFPSGGALYELEFHTAVQACDGLEPGLYRYDARRHRLTRLCGATPELAALVDDAAASAGIAAPTIQVAVILASRYRRLAWKYASIAYALTLKHVGVVYQTMYLAATAMGLAPCALGGGDSDHFARAAGLDYYEETSVGEFLLGSRGPSDGPAWACRGSGP